MVDVQTIGVIVTATSAVIGLIYYVFTARTTLQTRQAQLMMQIYDHINNKEFNKDYTEIAWWWTWKDWDEYWKKYGSVPEEVAKIAYVFTFFEGVGVLVEQGLLNPKLVGDMMGNYVLYSWAKLGDAVIEFRKRANSPDQWVKTEYLFSEMMKHYENINGFKFSPKMTASEI